MSLGFVILSKIVPCPLSVLFLPSNFIPIFLWEAEGLRSTFCNCFKTEWSMNPTCQGAKISGHLGWWPQGQDSSWFNLYGLGSSHSLHLLRNCCNCFHSHPVNLLDNEALSIQHHSTKESINDKRLKNHG